MVADCLADEGEFALLFHRLDQLGPAVGAGLVGGREARHRRLVEGGPVVAGPQRGEAAVAQPHESHAHERVGVERAYADRFICKVGPGGARPVLGHVGHGRVRVQDPVLAGLPGRGPIVRPGRGQVNGPYPDPGPDAVPDVRIHEEQVVVLMGDEVQVARARGGRGRPGGQHVDVGAARAGAAVRGPRDLALCGLLRQPHDHHTAGRPDPGQSMAASR